MTSASALELMASTLCAGALARASLPRCTRAPRRSSALLISFTLLLALAHWSAFPLLGLLGGASLELLVAASLLALSLLLALRTRPSPPIDASDQSAPDRSTSQLGQRLFTLLFAAAAVLVLACIVEHALRWPDGAWDAIAIWSLRGRALFRGGGRDSFSPELASSHPDYPLLIPDLLVQGFRLLGESRAWPPILGTAFAALTAALLFSTLSLLRSARAGLVAALVLISTPLFIWSATSGYADGPLAAYALGGCALLALDAEYPSPRLRLLAGLCASAAAWTKNEGLLVACSLAVALVCISGQRRRAALERLREGAPFILGALPLLMLLLLFDHLLAPSTDLLLEAHGGQLLARLVDPWRWRTIAVAALREPLDFSQWALSLLAVVFALAYALARAPQGSAARRVLLTLLCTAIGMASVYLLLSRDLPWHLSSSLSRLVWQLFPSALLAISLSLWKAERLPRSQSR